MNRIERMSLKHEVDLQKYIYDRVENGIIRLDCMASNSIQVDIPVKPFPLPIGTTYEEMKVIFDYKVCLEAVIRCKGNQVRAAKSLNINRNSLRKYLIKGAIYEKEQERKHTSSTVRTMV